MKNIIAHSDSIRKEMLEAISKSNIEELFTQIPEKARTGSLNLPDSLSEMEVQRKVKELAKKNKEYVSFLGAGVYNRFIPAGISQIAERFEFLTAYTPYQPEISQGTLQVMYEFQSYICKLTGMDICNASVYDVATACAEALFMAVRISKKDKVLVSNKLNPEYKKVIETYTHASEIELEYFDNIPEDCSNYACVMVQNPDFYGEIKDFKKPENCLLIMVTNPMALALLKTPAEYDVDIAVGDIQTLGIPMSFGGPYAGFIATKDKYMRQLAGRLCGKTLDKDGNIAYTLTIQTREQHIKREKATSNICSNQALVALCSTIYLALVGENGFYNMSLYSTEKAHELANKLEEKGYKVLNKNFFNEFVIETKNSDEYLNNLKTASILGGLKLDDKKVLISVTEMNTVDDIELYLKNV